MSPNRASRHWNMARRRGRSVPGRQEGHLHMNEDEQVNPFWSQGVQDAARVEGLRPAALPPILGTPESLPPVPADEWEQGDETPRPAQGLWRAVGSGGGMVRSQGRVPTGLLKWHLKHQVAGIPKLQDHRAPRCSGCTKKLRTSISLASTRTWRIKLRVQEFLK